MTTIYNMQSPPPYYDEKQVNRYCYEENGGAIDSDNTMSRGVRKGFIRKVYSLLTLQMLFTIGVTSFFIASDDAQKFAVSNAGQALVWISLVMIIGLMIGMYCNPNMVKKYPTNYIVLFGFTGCMSYIVGITTASYQVNSILIAFGATAGVTISLTIYAWQTKYDFTTKGGILLGSLVGIIVLGIINAFVRNPILHIVISAAGVVIFSAYIVYDTQLIVGGKHRKIQFDIDDYVLATITLYLDIINLFLYLLDLINNRD